MTKNKIYGIIEISAWAVFHGIIIDMKKLNTSPISGMQELTPARQAIFNQIKNQIAEVYRLHGFQNIETPTIDRAEILLAKAGGDTEKQIYKVVKTAETADDADQALRFDHTVPLARYVVEHENDLSFPFKVSQIGRNFRGERAQKGRFREFYQLDVDVVGRGQLPIAYDAEVIATAYAALKTFVKPQMKLRISNRKILTGLLDELGLSDKSEQIFGIIDHADKWSISQTEQALHELGISEAQYGRICTFMSIKGSRQEAIQNLQDMAVKDTTFQEGVAELEQVLKLLELHGLEDAIIADMLIVRGLDYYTGTVVETFLPEYKEIGSICSGGRYDNLAGHYTEQQLPGVGLSIGLTRLFYVLNEHNLLDTATAAPIDIAIVPISEQEYQFCFNLAKDLRAHGKITDVILTDKKLGDKLSYVAKIAKNVIVIGENEVTSSNLTVKNLETGELQGLDEYLVTPTL